MKRLIILILSCIPLIASAQEITFESLMRDYSQKEGYTTIELSPMMLKSMEVSNGIESVQVISVEDRTLIKDFIESVESTIAELDTLMSINSGGERVSIYGRSSVESGSIIELIVLTADKEEGVAVRITGSNIEISDIDSFIDEL